MHNDRSDNTNPFASRNTPQAEEKTPWELGDPIPEDEFSADERRDPSFDSYDDEDDEFDYDSESLQDDDEGQLSDWEEDEEDSDEEPKFFDSWPVGLLAIAAVAVLLLAIGGLGVMQERASLQDRIDDLQSQLALAADPKQLETEREARLESLEKQRELNRQIQQLELENRRLEDTVRGFEQQLEAQQAAASKAASQAERNTAAAVQKPAKQPSASSSSEGDWFVNFGSYRQRSDAERWAGRLKPSAGKVVVIAAPGGELFRVRIIGLGDKSAAQNVATKLESEFGLSKLWVGQQ